MSADIGFARSQNGRALRHHRIARSDNVGHFEAQMMLAAPGIAFEEFVDRAVIAQRLEQFDLGIGQMHEGDANPQMREVLRLCRIVRAVELGIGRLGGLDIRHGHADMVQASDFHLKPPE